MLLESKLPTIEITDSLFSTLLICDFSIIYVFNFDFYLLRDHPFKTSAFFRGGGIKNLPNLPTDSSKKLPTVGGRGQKS